MPVEHTRAGSTWPDTGYRTHTVAKHTSGGRKQTNRNLAMVLGAQAFTISLERAPRPTPPHPRPPKQQTAAAGWKLWPCAAGAPQRADGRRAASHPDASNSPTGPQPTAAANPPLPPQKQPWGKRQRRQARACGTVAGRHPCGQPPEQPQRSPLSPTGRIARSHPPAHRPQHILFSVRHFQRGTCCYDTVTRRIVPTINPTNQALADLLASTSN